MTRFLWDGIERERFGFFPPSAAVPPWPGTEHKTLHLHCICLGHTCLYPQRIFCLYCFCLFLFFDVSCTLPALNSSMLWCLKPLHFNATRAYMSMNGQARNAQTHTQPWCHTRLNLWSKRETKTNDQNLFNRTFSLLRDGQQNRTHHIEDNNNADNKPGYYSGLWSMKAQPPDTLSSVPRGKSRWPRTISIDREFILGSIVDCNSASCGPNLLIANYFEIAGWLWTRSSNRKIGRFDNRHDLIIYYFCQFVKARRHVVVIHATGVRPLI